MPAQYARHLMMSDIARAYERQRHAYVRVATAILGDAESASDAVQDAFVSAIRSRPQFKAEGPVEGWIWKIVINLARDRRRRGRHARPAADPAETPSQIEDPEPPAHDSALRAQIAQLPERQRLVIFLRFYADLDYAQIARVLGISTGTVGATLHAALRALSPIEGAARGAAGPERGAAACG